MDASGKPGTLYLVATPIGNLEDITLRALRVLKESDLIAAEDTRRTRKLLSHYGISKPLVSCFEENEQKRIPLLLESLRTGKSVALVSDAGSPGVSDPGYRLVQALLREGIPFTAVPGPSAVITALSLAGLPANHFSFYGFLPRTRSERLRFLEQAARQSSALVFFESPRRIASSILEMLKVFGNRQAALCREITKRFEEVHRGTIAEIIEKIERKPPKGELCLVVAGARPQEEAEVRREEALRKVERELERYRQEGRSVKEAALTLARQYGLSRREVYQMALGKPPHSQSGARGRPGCDEREEDCSPEGLEK